MKIHIIGGSGTGKTYLAKELSKKYNIPHYDLDELFWDNTAEQYGTKMPAEKRDFMLKDILKKDGWIIEGVFYDWLDESFEAADIIILLEIPVYICRFRIIRRLVKRKAGIEKAKRETLKSLADLLKWTGKFQKDNLLQIRAKLNKYQDKTVVLQSKREAARYIN